MQAFVYFRIPSERSRRLLSGALRWPSGRIYSLETYLILQTFQLNGQYFFNEMTSEHLVDNIWTHLNFKKKNLTFSFLKTK